MTAYEDRTEEWYDRGAMNAFCFMVEIGLHAAPIEMWGELFSQRERWDSFLRSSIRWLRENQLNPGSHGFVLANIAGRIARRIVFAERKIAEGKALDPDGNFNRREAFMELFGDDSGNILAEAIYKERERQKGERP